MEFTLCFQSIKTVFETSPSIVHNLYFYVTVLIVFEIYDRLLSITEVITYRTFQV